MDGCFSSTTKRAIISSSCSSEPVHTATHAEIHVFKINKAAECETHTVTPVSYPIKHTGIDLGINKTSNKIGEELNFRALLSVPNLEALVYYAVQ